MSKYSKGHPHFNKQTLRQFKHYGFKPVTENDFLDHCFGMGFKTDFLIISIMNSTSVITKLDKHKFSSLFWDKPYDLNMVLNQDHVPDKNNPVPNWENIISIALSPCNHKVIKALFKPVLKESELTAFVSLLSLLDFYARLFLNYEKIPINIILRNNFSYHIYYGDLIKLTIGNFSTALNHTFEDHSKLAVSSEHLYFKAFTIHDIYMHLASVVKAHCYSLLNCHPELIRNEHLEMIKILNY